MSEPGFRVTGDATSASIEVSGMNHDQLIDALRHVMLTVYSRSGIEITGDDLTLANIVMGELNQAIEKVERERQRLRRAQWVLWGATALNVAAAFWNLGVALGH